MRATKEKLGGDENAKMEAVFSNPKLMLFASQGKKGAKKKNKATCHDMWHLATWLTCGTRVGPTSYTCVLPLGHLITHQPKK